MDHAVNRRDRDRDELQHDKDNETMMDAESESDSDSNDNTLRPPPDLLQRARDILGRPVSLKDVMHSWDRSSEHTTVQARTGAALERMLLFEEEEQGDHHDQGDAQARLQQPQRAQRVDDGAATGPSNTNGSGNSNSKGKGKGKAPAAAKNVIELSDSDGDYRDDSDDDEVVVVSGGRPSGKTRRTDTMTHNEKSKSKARAEVQYGRAGSSKDKGKGRVDTKKRKRETDDDDDSDDSLPPSPYKLKRMPRHHISPRAGSGGSSSSSSDAYSANAKKAPESDSSADSLLAENRRKLRNASSPPTPPLGGAGASASASGAASTSKLAPAPQHKEEEPLSPLVQVLAMVPNVCPEHAASLIEQYSAHPNCVEHVIDSLFSATSYPRAKSKAMAQTGGEDGVGSGSGAGKGKGKGRAETSDEDKDKALEARYTNVQARAQPAPEYFEAVFDLLEGEFPSVPIPHIRKTLGAHGYLYTPTVYALQADAAASPAGYKALLNARKSKGAASRTVSACAELEEERAWLVSKTARADALEAARRAEEACEAEEEAAGLVVECGCCFGDYVWGKIVQCPEAHLFCMECARKNAETAMGNRQTEIRCMDQDGCTAEFTRSELERFLKTNQLLLLDKLRSESALDAAQLAGLSRCPYCPFAGIIDNPDEKLLRCENEECLRVTCRACQKPDHLPKSCAEYEADLKANSIHKVEEAMTAAMVRKCPKCQQNYVKEYGCNKIICSNASCRALSCYMCMEVIKGYDHFAGQPIMDAQGRPTGRNTTSKCVLWDHNEGTNEHARIEAARLAAVNELKSAAQEHGQEVAAAEQEALDKLKLGKPAQAGYVAHPAHRVHAYPHNVPGGAGAAGAAAVAAQQAAAAAAAAAVPRQYDHLMQAQRDLQALMNQMRGGAYNPYLNVAAAAGGAAAAANPLPAAPAHRQARAPPAPRRRRR